MNKMLIKVCGMRNPENIRELIHLEPDIIGLIFHPESPRYVSEPTQLAEVLSQRQNSKLAGVFVNASLATIKSLHQILTFDFIQLHGQESPEFARSLRDSGLQVIKAFGIQKKEDLEPTVLYQGCVDYFLFDTKTSTHGGSGKKFNWEILEHYTGNTPFLLSGGIKPVDEIKISHPQFAGLDINSGFEIGPGLKSMKKIEHFINKYKNA